MNKKVGRNDPCPCGSGKKHKNCCMTKLASSKRTFKAKILSGPQAQQKKSMEEGFIPPFEQKVDLMERAFGKMVSKSVEEFEKRSESEESNEQEQESHPIENGNS